MTIFNRIIIMVMLAVIISSAPARAAQQTTCKGSKPFSVYIDPFFGGQEFGPNVGQGHVGKELTLRFGLKLKALLDKKGIATCLSRDGDYSLTLDERLTKSQHSQSNLYFAITMSSEKDNCINLHIPREKPRAARQEKDIDLDTIMKDITSDDKRERSLAISERLRRSMAENLKQVCIKVLVEDQAILKKSESPIVIMDISIGKDSSSFVRQTIISDDFVAFVADSIVLYFTSNQRNP